MLQRLVWSERSAENERRLSLVIPNRGDGSVVRFGSHLYNYSGLFSSISTLQKQRYNNRFPRLRSNFRVPPGVGRSMVSACLSLNCPTCAAFAFTLSHRRVAAHSWLLDCRSTRCCSHRLETRDTAQEDDTPKNHALALVSQPRPGFDFDRSSCSKP